MWGPKSENRKSLLSSHEAEKCAETTTNTHLSFPGSVSSTAEEPNLDLPSKPRRHGQVTAVFAPGQIPGPWHQNLQKKVQGEAPGPLGCHRGSLGCGKKEEKKRRRKTSWGGGLGRSMERQRVRKKKDGAELSFSLSPLCNPVWEPHGHHIKDRWMSRVCVRVVHYLPIAPMVMTGGIAVFTYVVFNNTPLKEV